MLKRIIVVAGLLGCTPTISRFVVSGASTVKLTGVQPAIATLGQVVTMTYSVSPAEGDCSAAVGAESASCSPRNNETCTCTFAVDTATPEGALTVTATIRASDGQVSANGVLQVDKSPPTIAPPGFHLQRTAVGSVDALTVDANGAVDPPPSYSGQTVSRLRIWADPNAAAPVADVAFPATAPISIGTTTTSPADLWASAIDMVGNESARIPLPALSDHTPPTVDGDAITFTYLPVGTSEQLTATANAFTDDSGSVAQVNIFASAGAAAALATAVPATDGSLPTTPVGDVVVQRVFVSASDKAGNVSPRTYAKHVTGTFNLLGRAAFSDSSNPMAMYTFALAQNPPGAPGFATSGGVEYTGTAVGVADTVELVTGATTPAATLTTWTVNPASSPPRRNDTAMVYDKKRHAVVLFGGRTNAAPLQALADTWEYNGTWSKIGGAAPPARYGHVMAYDAARGVVVLFGGDTLGDCGQGLSFCNDTWEYDGTWKKVAAQTPPSARIYAAMAYDSSLEQMVLFGGQTQSSVCENSNLPYMCGGTFLYSGASWTQIKTVLSPDPSFASAITYDAMAGVTLLTNGQTYAHFNSGDCTEGICTRNWQFDGALWNEVPVSAAQPPSGAPGSMTFVPDISLTYSASLTDGKTPAPQTSLFTSFGTEAWAVPGISSPAGFGSALPNNVTAYDAERQALILYGPCAPEGSPAPATWELTGAVGSNQDPTQVFRLQLDENAILGSLAITYVGDGTSGGGSPNIGVDLYAWNWFVASWDPVGTQPNPAGGGTTTVISLTSAGSQQVSNYANEGLVWFAAVDDGAGAAAALSTDYFEIRASYEIP